MTTNCTVKCPFCALANKGPIAQKASFQSATEIIDEFSKHSRKQSWIVLSDALYWGTDPFDAKWHDSANGELDYLDIARYYWDTVANTRYLNTSTAIPLGEEWRILRFADYFIRQKQAGELIYDNFRISRTIVNLKRASNIASVLFALHGQEVVEQHIDISQPRVDNAIAKRGKAWDLWLKRGGSLNDWDILGPNCRDGVIIGVNKVQGIAMVGASPDKPKGDEYFDIKRVDPETNNIVYTIPHYRHKPDFKTVSWSEIYPPIKVTELQFDADNTTLISKKVKTLHNVHRTFARFVGKLTSAVAKWGSLAELSQEQRAQLSTLITPDVQEIRDFLALGSNNKAMENFLSYATDLGLIE